MVTIAHVRSPLGRAPRPVSMAKARKAPKARSLEGQWQEATRKGAHDGGGDGRAMARPSQHGCVADTSDSKLPAKASSVPTAPAINPDSEQLIAELIALIPQEQMTADIQKRVGQASVDQTQKQGKIMHRMFMDQTQLTLKADPAAFSATWEASALQLLELWKNQRTASLPWTLTQTGKPSLWLAFRM